MKTLWILAAAATFAACHNRSEETGAAPNRGDTTAVTPSKTGYDTTANKPTPSAGYDTTAAQPTTPPSAGNDTTMKQPTTPPSAGYDTTSKAPTNPPSAGYDTTSSGVGADTTMKKGADSSMTHDSASTQR
jgi:hypothetical protein